MLDQYSAKHALLFQRPLDLSLADYNASIRCTGDITVKKGRGKALRRGKNHDSSDKACKTAGRRRRCCHPNLGQGHILPIIFFLCALKGGGRKEYPLTPLPQPPLLPLPAVLEVARVAKPDKGGGGLFHRKSSSSCAIVRPLKALQRLSCGRTELRESRRLDSANCSKKPRGSANKRHWKEGTFLISLGLSGLEIAWLFQNLPFLVLYLGSWWGLQTPGTSCSTHNDDDHLHHHHKEVSEKEQRGHVPVLLIRRPFCHPPHHTGHTATILPQVPRRPHAYPVAGGGGGDGSGGGGVGGGIDPAGSSTYNAAPSSALHPPKPVSVHSTDVLLTQVKKYICLVGSCGT